MQLVCIVRDNDTLVVMRRPSLEPCVEEPIPKTEKASKKAKLASGAANGRCMVA
jgi:hypothetical protein